VGQVPVSALSKRLRIGGEFEYLRYETEIAARAGAGQHPAPADAERQQGVPHREAGDDAGETEDEGRGGQLAAEGPASWVGAPDFPTGRTTAWPDPPRLKSQLYGDE
jgi:hypothetical protein